MNSDSSAQIGRKSVLYVTADEGQADVFSREIQGKFDFTVRTAGTVNEGIEILGSSDVECIVSDYDLPDVDGLAFLQSVRSQFADFPFILFTSEGNETVAGKAITARVTDYLIQEQFQEQWGELAALIEHAIQYYQSQPPIGDPETRAKVILEASLDPMAVVQDKTIVYANQNALDVFEVERRSALTEIDIADVISPDSRDITTAMVDAIQAGETNVDRRKQVLLGLQGGRTPIELTAVSISWNGAPAILFIYRDVTDRVDRKFKLRRFRQAVEAAGYAIYITDTDGTIEYANPEFEAITGYSPDEARGNNPRILNSGKMSADYFEDLWKTILSGAVWEETLINRRKDGEKYHAHQMIAPITNLEGTIQGFVAIQTDITERKHLEEELTEAKERYESLFDSIRDAILVSDTDRRIIDCNPAFTDLFDYEFEEIEGKPTRTVYESEAEFEAMGEAIAGHIGEPEFTHTVTYEKKSGQTFPGETNVSYFRDAEGEIIGFVAVIRDITDRNQRLRQIQMVDRILQHNFNNDMNVIEGYSETIQEETTGEIASYASKIRESGHKLRRTIKKEQEVTEFLSGQPEQTTIEIEPMVERLVSNMCERNPEVEISSEIQTDATCRAVPEINRAIEEILQNAIIHADRETLKIHVAVEEGAETLQIRFSDNNSHIPDMERKVLLEGEEMAPLYHGSGIGLWLVNLIVTHSNGKVKAETNEPRGNTIVFQLSTRH